MKWISVKEKKPKPNETLWACNEKYPLAFVCFYDENSNLFIADGKALSVTHYIYLKNSVYYSSKPKKPETMIVKFSNRKRLSEAPKKKRKYTKRKLPEVNNEAGA